MTEERIKRMIDIITNELFDQSMCDGLDAPVVWSEGRNPEFLSIDGSINVRALAMAIVARS